MVVPLQYYVLAMVLIETLRFTVGVGCVEVGRLAADLGGTSRGGEDKGEHRG